MRIVLLSVAIAALLRSPPPVADRRQGDQRIGRAVKCDRAFGRRLGGIVEGKCGPPASASRRFSRRWWWGYFLAGATPAVTASRLSGPRGARRRDRRGIRRNDAVRRRHHLAGLTAPYHLAAIRSRTATSRSGRSRNNKGRRAEALLPLSPLLTSNLLLGGRGCLCRGGFFSAAADRRSCRPSSA